MTVDLERGCDSLPLPRFGRLTADRETWNELEYRSAALARPRAGSGLGAPSFEPGAAHVSKTRSPGSQARNNGGTMLTASWRVIVPARSCATNKVCNSLCAGDLRRAARSASTRQALL